MSWSPNDAPRPPRTTRNPSSRLLRHPCFLDGEPGADHGENALSSAAICTANWSEGAQKVNSRGADWEIVRNLVLSYGLTVEPVAETGAITAARLWQQGSGLSLGDR